MTEFQYIGTESTDAITPFLNFIVKILWDKLLANSWFWVAAVALIGFFILGRAMAREKEYQYAHFET